MNLIFNMFKYLLLVFVFGCEYHVVSPDLDKTHVLLRDISFGYIDNFDINNKYFNNIINLREDCFNIRSSSGLVGGKLFIGTVAHNAVGYFAYFQKNTTAFIHDMCIGSAYRGVGVGKQLLSWGLSQIESLPWVSTLELDVLSNNRTAIKLYKHAGFKIIYKFKDRDGEELFRMSKDITN